jgi:hypothetical protein
MVAARIAALLALGALGLPASAEAYWGMNSPITESGSSPVSDMSRSGHAIVGWREEAGGGAVARAAPGQMLGAVETLTTTGDGVEDVAVAENGDAFAAWTDDAGVHVATRPPGGPWGAPETLAAAAPFALAAGPDGDATVVVAASSGLQVYRRVAGDPAFTAGATAATTYSPFVHAGYVGDRVVVVGHVGEDVIAHTIEADGTLGAADLVDSTAGPPGMDLATDRGGAGAVVTWPAFEGGTSSMRAATADADGVFGAGQKASGDLVKGVLYPEGAIGPDGRTIVGWGDGDFDPVALVEAGSPTSAFGPVTAPPVNGRRSDELQLAYDSRGSLTAVWYFTDQANGGQVAHIDSSVRLAGRTDWCPSLGGHMVRLVANTLRIHTDAQGRGLMAYGEAAPGPGGTGKVWTQWYEAPTYTECPPPPSAHIGFDPAPPGSAPPEEAPPAIPVRRVALSLPRRATVDRRGRVRIVVRCSGDAAACAGRLALKRRRALWAKRSFTVPRGRHVIRLRLRRAARRSLARRRRAAVTLELRLRDQALERSRLALRRR